MNNYEMTKIQFIERLVSEVNGRKKDLPNKGMITNGGRFFGHIGPNMTFSGEWQGSDENEFNFYKFQTEKIWFAVQGQQVLSLIVKKGADAFCRERHQMPRTLYEIYTNRCGNTSCVSKDAEALKQLRVYHAPDEDLDSVFDEFCDAYAYSKAIEAYDQKNQFRGKNVAGEWVKAETLGNETPKKLYRCKLSKAVLANRAKTVKQSDDKINE